MLEGPIGAAAFNNEFGRPNLNGYFRSFELHEAAGPDGSKLVRAYDNGRIRLRLKKSAAGLSQ